MVQGDGVLLTRLAKKYVKSEIGDGLLDMVGRYAENKLFHQDDEEKLKEVAKKLTLQEEFIEHIKTVFPIVIEVGAKEANKKLDIKGLTEEQEAELFGHVGSIFELLALAALQNVIASGDLDDDVDDATA